MKTIYLTILFLLLGLLISGCANSGKVMLSTDSDETVISGNDSYDDSSTGDKPGDGDSQGTDKQGGKMQGSVVKGDESLSFDAKSDDSRDFSNDETYVGTGSNDDKMTAGIYVYVCGSVAKPGVYELNEGSRICDALELAGGVTEDGVPEALDQAKPVADGQTIYVPNSSEEWDRTSQDNSGVGSSTSDPAMTGININTASKDELMTLPGIGESKATDIIRYREEHGGFKTIEEIMNIQGIKEGVFNKIKDMISC